MTYVVFDTKTNDFKAITREDVGKKMVSKGIDPALEGTFKVKVRDTSDDKHKGGYSSEGDVMEGS